MLRYFILKNKMLFRPTVWRWCSRAKNALVIGDDTV